MYVFIKKRCGTKNEDGETIAKKDGIHFVFPNITIDYSSGFIDGIRDQWITAYNEGKIMTEYRCLNTPEDIFDKNLCNPSTWLVYGCAKKDNFPYILRYVLDSSGDETDISTVYDSNTLVDLMDKFSIRHEDREVTPYKMEPEWLKLKDIIVKVDDTKSTDSDKEEVDDAIPPKVPNISPPTFSAIENSCFSFLAFEKFSAALLVLTVKFSTASDVASINITSSSENTSISPKPAKVSVIILEVSSRAVDTSLFFVIVKPCSINAAFKSVYSILRLFTNSCCA